MSNIRSNRAPGPIGNWPRRGSKGSHGWPSTATMSDFTPSTPIVMIRAVAALPSRSRTRPPGRTLNFSGAASPLARTSTALSSRAPRQRGIGEIVLI